VRKNTLAIFVLSVGIGFGQTPSTPPAAAAELPMARQFLRDEWRIWSSPLKRKSYASHTVAKYVIPFTLISAALIATDNRTSDVLPNTKDQAHWSAHVSQLGAAYSLGGVSGGAFLLGKVTGNRRAEESGWLAMHAIAHTQLVVFAAKQITNRRRPPNRGTRSGFWDGGDSFPSGHSASSFAVATVFAYEYRDHIAVPIVAYTLASAVAASRMSAQRHWVSDIFVGSSTGFLLGRFVYRQHHDNGLPGSPVNRTSKLMPKVGLGAKTFALDWTL
jgi:membrane-associated phospholipid phosphatase